MCAPLAYQGARYWRVGIDRSRVELLPFDLRPFRRLDKAPLYAVRGDDRSVACEWTDNGPAKPSPAHGWKRAKVGEPDVRQLEPDRPCAQAA